MPNVAGASAATKILPPVGPSDNDCAQLWDVVALGPSNAWAVGGDGCGTPNQEIQHWDGTKTVRYPAATIDSGGYDTLYSVSAAGPHDIWAVGEGGTDSSGFETLIGHWDGKRWANIPAPGSANIGLADVAAVAKGNVWFAGYEGAGTALLVHRTSGKNTFVRFRSSNRVHFNSIWAAGPADIWAGGNDYLIHGDGRHWQRVRLPASMEIARLQGTSASNVWAMGESPDGGKIAHFNGHSWSMVPLPSGQDWVQMNGLAVGGPSDVWIAGYEQSSGAPLAHWDGRSWSTVGVYAPTCSRDVFGVALTATRVLAVGSVYCAHVTGPMWWSGPRS